jgi:hypothetical protein
MTWAACTLPLFQTQMRILQVNTSSPGLGATAFAESESAAGADPATGTATHAAQKSENSILAGMRNVLGRLITMLTADEFPLGS